MEIVRLEPSQKQRAAASYARAFFDYPQFTCYHPSREWRKKHFERYIAYGLDIALKYGEVYATADFKGLIGWFPPGTGDVFNTWTYLRTPGFFVLLWLMGWKNSMRASTCDDYVAKVHQQAMPGPHWYLWGLGVDPDCQGQGIGTRLMQPGLARADDQGLPCYLETHDEANIPYYQKRGFELIRAEQVPGVGLPFWCFVRQPNHD